MSETVETDARREALAIAIRHVALMIAPHFRTMAAQGRDWSRKLWPNGGVPQHVTYHEVLQCHIAKLRRAGERIVAHDVAHAAVRGPWPSGSSLRAETAIRLAREDELVRRLGQVRPSLLDTAILEASAGAERTHLGDALGITAVLLSRLADAIEKEGDVRRRFEIARLLSHYVVQGLLGMETVLSVSEGEGELVQTVRALLEKAKVLDRSARALESEGSG